MPDYLSHKGIVVSICFWGVFLAVLILVLLNELDVTSISPWIPIVITAAIYSVVYVVWIVMMIFLPVRVRRYK